MDDEYLYDVIVAGCGPVGAIAAHILAHRGLKVLIVERDTVPYLQPRAIHLDHEIMRILQGAGLAERILPQLSVPAGSIHFGADLGVIRQYQEIIETPRLGWASDYFFYQPDLEAELRLALTERKTVTTQFGASVSYVSQNATSVTVRITGAAGDWTARGRYLLACDGGKSEIRKHLGIGLEDLGFDEPWIVVDANVDGELSFPAFEGAPEGVDLASSMVMIADPSRPTSVIPGVGRHRRWEFMLLPGENADDYMDGSLARKLLAPWTDKAPVEIIRVAVYRFHALLADRWRDNRVFLAGDAAHQTPPFFGQGLCHGIRDVANLAWKLELAIQTDISDALLDSYELERLPQVRSVVQGSIKTGQYICTLDPDRAKQRDAEMRQVAQRTKPGYVDLIPPLEAGVLDDLDRSKSAVGTRFIQPPMRDVANQEMLLDGFAGAGFRLLARSEFEVPAASLSSLRALGLEVDILRFQPNDGAALAIDVLLDVSGEMTKWFDYYQCNCAIIRPDAYVFGTAETLAEVARLVEDLKNCLFG